MQTVMYDLLGHLPDAQADSEQRRSVRIGQGERQRHESAHQHQAEKHGCLQGLGRIPMVFQMPATKRLNAVQREAVQ